jgi:hypothetical protein
MPTDNSIHLIRAAQQRHEHTRAKAIAAMHELDRSGAALTFESVARHAGVSRSWIYTQTDTPTQTTKTNDSVTSAGPSRAHRYLLRNAPATTPCGGASKSPTAATANSPTKTSGYAASSPAPSDNSVTNRPIAVR